MLMVTMSGVEVPLNSSPVVFYGRESVAEAYMSAVYR